MAEKTWKLGDLEFKSEQEYLDASKDLKKIKIIMQKYDITNPAEARAVLEEIADKPVFASGYGLKFVERLEKTAGGAPAVKIAGQKGAAGGPGGQAAKPPKETGLQKETKPQKEAKSQKEAKAKKEAQHPDRYGDHRTGCWGEVSGSGRLAAV